MSWLYVWNKIQNSISKCKFKIIIKIQTDVILDIKTLKIEKFFLKRYKCFQETYKLRSYKQLSDHYGISVILKYADPTKNEINAKILQEFSGEFVNDYTSNSVLDIFLPGKIFYGKIKKV